MGAEGRCTDGSGQRYEDALEAYEKAAVVDPTFPRLWYKKGQALEALNRQSESDSAFGKARDMGYNVTCLTF